MILHIISTSPFTHDALQRCRDIATAQDGILLIEDAVLALSNAARFLEDLPSPHLFVLEPDRLARGMALPQTPVITAVDYEGFVTLTAQFAKSVSWF